MIITYPNYRDYIVTPVYRPPLMHGYHVTVVMYVGGRTGVPVLPAPGEDHLHFGL